MKALLGRGVTVAVLASFTLVMVLAERFHIHDGCGHDGAVCRVTAPRGSAVHASCSHEQRPTSCCGHRRGVDTPPRPAERLERHASFSRTNDCAVCRFLGLKLLPATLVEEPAVTLLAYQAERPSPVDRPRPVVPCYLVRAPPRAA